MIRRPAQIVSSQPGIQPVTYIQGFLLGWGIDKDNSPFVIFEDASSHCVQALPLQPNSLFVLDSSPAEIPEI